MNTGFGHLLFHQILLLHGTNLVHELLYVATQSFYLRLHSRHARFSSTARPPAGLAAVAGLVPSAVLGLSLNNLFCKALERSRLPLHDRALVVACLAHGKFVQVLSLGQSRLALREGPRPHRLAARVEHLLKALLLVLERGHNCFLHIVCRRSLVDLTHQRFGVLFELLVPLHFGEEALLWVLAPVAHAAGVLGARCRCTLYKLVHCRHTLGLTCTLGCGALDQRRGR
mmetsp:Transcript_48187/g.70644  ORF Transcript_48187/g.70644 Transcript_48187/m.70644 type:complete len:228 (-) Transcript_48187:271-954(-)